MKHHESSSKRLTQLLLDWSNGNRAALEELTPLVHEELHRLAHHYMRRERADHTLQTTALVNEAYLRLIDQKHVQCQNRTDFFAIAAQLMRHILVDHARSRQSLKRGGGARRVSLDEAMTLCHERTDDLIALNDALERLATIDPRKSKVVELRFFGGLSVEETAAVLKLSTVTVMRDWSMAKAWLYDAMTNEA
jgi:RNA polymerase sigma factor (TIGR02999 family)